MTRFTHLGRIVDLTIPTTQASIVVVLVAAVWGYVVGGWAAAVDGGVGAMLGWMLTRELDPDHPSSALLVTIIIGVLGVLGADVGLRATLITVAAARVMMRTTGLAPKLTDLGVLGVVAVVSAMGVFGWAAGMGLAVVFALDSGSDRARLGIAALVGLAVTGMGGLAGNVTTSWTPPGIIHFGVVIAGVLASALARHRPLFSVGDLTGEVLDPSRLIMTRMVITGMAVVTAIAGGGFGVEVTSVVWAALIVVGFSSRLRPLMIRVTDDLKVRFSRGGS